MFRPNTVLWRVRQLAWVGLSLTSSLKGLSKVLVLACAHSG